MFKRNILLPALGVITVGGAAIFAVSTAYAQGFGTQQSTLVQEIAQKFNLNPSDVQAVFTQNQQERQAAMQAKYKAMLDLAVKNGQLTQAQEDLIVAKQSDLKSQMQTNLQNRKNMTAAQRKQAMQQAQQDLKNWAQQNGIDMKYLRFFGGFGRRMRPAQKPTTQQ